MKKTLAILLSLALVICMIPATAATAFAETTQLTDADVTLSPESALYTGAEHKISEGKVRVTVKNGEGTELTKDSNYTVAWSKDGTTGATPKNAGEYTLTVTGTGSYSGSVKKTYTVEQVNLSSASIECSPLKKSDFSSTTVDSQKGWDNISVEKTIASLPNEKAITVKIGSETVATSIYKTTIIKYSDDKIKVVIEPADGQNNANITGTRTAIFNVTTELTDSTYKIVDSNCKEISDQTYTGSALTPTVYVVKKDAANLSEKLTPGTDYKVTYSNNINGNSTAKITVTGINKYSGTVEDTFQINGKKISNCTINVGNTVQYQKPEVTVYDGSKKLTEGTDYQTINSSDYNTNAVGSNSGTVTITGIGNYTETKQVTFKVVAGDYEIKSSDVTWTNTSVMYTGSSQSIGVSLKKGGSNYKITYTKDGEVVTPKEVGTYTATLTGTGNYAGTVTTTFTINPITLDQVYVSFGSTIYNKDVKRYVPSVTLKAYSSNTVIPTTDYKVKYNLFGYSSYVTPYVSITPVTKGEYGKTQTGDTQTTKSTGALEKGTVSPYASNGYKDFNYTGSIDQTTTSSVSVTVTRAYYKDGGSEEKITLTNGDTMNYVGERVYLDLTVYDSTNKRYLSSYEYTVSYKNSAGKTVSYMQDADTYTMTIENSSSYSYGTFKTTKTFTIKGNDISAYTVTLDKTSIDATGSAITLPKVTRVSSGSSTLSSSEYTYTYQDANGKAVTSITAPGTYKVVVKGAGKYSGTTSATFKVVGKAQSITGVASSYKKYKTSKAFQLTPSATEGTFTYSSSDTSVATVSSTGLVTPLKAGRAKITITTTGNKKYDPAEYSTVIKVYPNKAVQTQKPWTTGSGKIKVRWNKQEGVTRYEVRYSRNKSFASGTYLTKSVDAAVNDYTTQSTTIKNLVRGTTYYVKIRAVTEVYNDNGKKLTYYGNWSGWRTIKTK